MAQAHRWRLRLLLFRIPMLLLVLPAALGATYYLLARRAGWHHAERIRYICPKLYARALLFMLGVSLTIEGEDNVPKQGLSGIVLCNHNSRLDPYILIAAIPVFFKSFWSMHGHVMREKYYLVQWFGRVFDQFFIHDNADPQLTAGEFKRAREYLRDGNTLSLFPEGRFSGDGNVGKFGLACVDLAIRTGAVIHPMLIVGSEDYFEKWKARRTRREVRVIFMRPRPTDGLNIADKALLGENLVTRMNERLREERVQQHVPE